MVGTLRLQHVPSPSSGTFVHAVTRQVVAESVSASLDLIFDPRGQEGSEGAVGAAVDH